MARFFLVSGALVLALGVAMGAVSAHAAKGAAHPDAVRLLQTAVLYQLVHGIGIVIAGVLAQRGASRWLLTMGALHLAGVLLFCGSLYLLAYAGASTGLLAPLGGLAFIGGWLALAAYGARKPG
jgi:uncharacterized membrane protein YgdD (TMEM256/DUF423 family)